MPADAAPPEFILHIGMGKTGTSAIQAALREAADGLARQNTRYLGGHFRIEGRDLTEWAQLEAFFNQPADALAAAGEDYADAIDLMMEADGLDKVIMSQESLIGWSKGVVPFLAPLQARIRVRYLAWGRDPMGWLPSAYGQWGVRHKTISGAVERYAIGGRRVVGYYRDLLAWAAAAPEALELRAYRRDEAIVPRFAEAAGIALPETEKRVYERAQPAELVLRALFNSGFKGAVLPDAYDRAVGGDRARLQPFDKLVEGLLDYSGTAEIVEENAALFDDIAKATGLDLRSLGETPPEMPALPQLRRRLVDHLTAITLDQARRIAELEERLTKLEGGPRG